VSGKAQVASSTLFKLLPPPVSRLNPIMKLPSSGHVNATSPVIVPPVGVHAKAVPAAILSQNWYLAPRPSSFPVRA